MLGLDATGRLVVVELKRGTADRDVHLQAITYAALVSRFDLGTLAQAHRDFLSRRDQALEIDACRRRLLDHVDGEGSPEMLQRPRQVIIAADFPKQVTSSVVWLSEMGIDIDLVQVGLWRVEGSLVAGFAKVYPTPEVEEFPDQGRGALRQGDRRPGPTPAPGRALTPPRWLRAPSKPSAHRDRPLAQASAPPKRSR
ncbi:hypothetical protein ACFYT7_26610 [Streptomyces sp. NPDC004041]|uniref:hypothetical protein n=1 Tax=Streptomyces sp. NPDC004041 TaxID=3364688 RepID=UPI0036806888